MRSPAAFRWFVVRDFATALTLVSLAAHVQAEGLAEETSRLVERLNFRSSDKEFTFPAGPDEVSEICERLCEIGPEARGAIPTLIKSLADDERNGSAWFALGGIGAEAVPALRGALRDNRDDTRVLMAAADALRDMRRAASSAIPELVDLLDHKDMEVRHAAIDALVSIDVPSRERAVAISGLLLHESERTRDEAAFALRRMQGAEIAIPNLIRVAADDKSPYVRVQAFRALAHIDRAGRQAAEILVDSLNDDTSGMFFTVGR